MDPADAFAELGRIRLGEVDLADVLQRVADLAKQTVPDALEVSVTLVRADGAQTAAFTGELARELDEWQYVQDRGPCLDAATSGGNLRVRDVTVEERWPVWAERARAAGVGSSLSMGLPIQQAVVGALNLYAERPHAFDDEAVSLAGTFAGYAAVALANAHLYDSTAALARQMQAAMSSRAVIEQAKGIIMGQRRCSADEAFAMLAKTSQETNSKLRDVAATLVRRVSPGS
ncbi:GAF and ANTAR domain-containing protein [Micromonospora sp. RHAY321]|uniref:GAF and ANTAR domain-containing protein n=1 Tax=Micromonospora sp. RHAY321 TaxID=2944807 RepID=UPI00207C2932|nr:GAF and ANTAR domain-containing protein [Micromonospora sp. RHAY321]MCO1595369.1 GAF and ANTAR domain-containing protein [Micromonospora sp. RHAY321]